MYIYNITNNVSEKIHNQWLEWMRKKHIPAMLATGKFSQAILVFVSAHEEMGGITYATQYKCKSAELLKEFYREYAPKLNKEVMKKFPNQVVVFGTELKVIEEFENKI